MGVPLAGRSLTDFLSWEEQQPDRHECFRGEIFAMVGGTARHNRVIMNLGSYSSLPSLEEYALVDPVQRHAEVFTRAATGADTWTLVDQSRAIGMVLASIGLTIPMADLFKGLEPAAI